MIPDHTKANSKPDTPKVDEGWWAAIFSEEDSIKPDLEKPKSKITHPPRPSSVDWDQIMYIYERDMIIDLLVKDFNRGGLLVKGGDIHGFVPLSHLVESSSSMTEEERLTFLANYVGKTLKLKVIECVPYQERVVLSERAAQAGEGCRKEIFHSLKTGSIASGTVTNVTGFGVFVDLGGVEGLIHVSELSWGRVQDPETVLSVGQSTRVLVLSVSERTGRIALSLKRLYNNPWETLSALYNPGDEVPATVTSITRFGVFARLNEGIEGLIHISSIPLQNGQKNINQMFSIGELITVRILHINVEHRRLGLGLLDE